MTDEERMGFRGQIEEAARVEVARVLADLDRLKFDAHQVRHVLNAMGLPVPPALTAFIAGEAEPAPPPVAPPPAAPPPAVAPPEAEPAQAEPEPAPPAPPAPEPPAPPKPPPTAVEPPAPPPAVAPPEPTADAPAPTRKDLKRMPVVVGQGGEVTSRNTHVAKRQWAVYVAVNSRPTSIGSEIAKLVDMPQSRVTDYMRDMAEIGLIRRTGRNRHALDRGPGMAGRSSVEYAPLGEPTASPTKAPEPPTKAPESKPAPAPAEAPEIDAEALARIRDVVVAERDMFSPRTVAEKAKVPVATAMAGIELLLARGVLTDESPTPDMPLFAYAPPKDPGEAAKRDAARRKADSAQTANGGAAPVAGTGRAVKANNPEVQGLINAAQRAGATVKHAPNGHFEVRLPEALGGGRVLISATPSNPRTVMNDRARLRRTGLLKS